MILVRQTRASVPVGVNERATWLPIGRTLAEPEVWRALEEDGTYALSRAVDRQGSAPAGFGRGRLGHAQGIRRACWRVGRGEG